MRFSEARTVREIAQMIEARQIIGDPECKVLGLNEVHHVQEGELTFVDHPKYLKRALSSRAVCILIPPDVEISPNGKVLVVVSDPFRAFNQLAKKMSPRTFPQDTWIHPRARLGKNVRLSPGVYIGADVIIGDNTMIFPNVAILDGVQIGKRCKIGPNTVIGYDAFYYKRYPDGHREPMYSCGTVIIEDDVEIGACCTIDRGVTDITRIGQGTKVDNHVHIGHDVKIGKNCVIAAQVGIAGGCILEDEVVLWGQVGINKSVRIGRGAVVQAKAGIVRDLPGGKSYTGAPAEETRTHHRKIALMNFLIRHWDRIRHWFQNEE